MRKDSKKKWIRVVSRDSRLCDRYKSGRSCGAGSKIRVWKGVRQSLVAFASRKKPVKLGDMQTKHRARNLPARSTVENRFAEQSEENKKIPVVWCRYEVTYKKRTRINVVASSTMRKGEKKYKYIYICFSSGRQECVQRNFAAEIRTFSRKTEQQREIK